MTLVSADERLCGDLLGGVWSSNQQDSVSLVSNNTEIVLGRRGTGASGIAYPWLLVL